MRRTRPAPQAASQPVQQRLLLLNPPCSCASELRAPRSSQMTTSAASRTLWQHSRARSPVCLSAGMFLHERSMPVGLAGMRQRLRKCWA